MNIAINFEKAKADALIRGLVGSEGQIKLAQARALRKTGTFMRTRIKREAAKQLRMPQKAIGDRFFLSRVRPGDDQVSLWVGAWNVSPYSIGKPAQVGARTYGGKKARSVMAGVRVGKHFFRGAFLGKIYSGTEKIWIRKSSRYFSSALYPTQKQHHAGYRGSMGRSLGGRFPVVRAAVPIDGVLARVIERDGPEIEAKFMENFGRELNYEVNIKGM